MNSVLGRTGGKTSILGLPVVILAWGVWTTIVDRKVKWETPFFYDINYVWNDKVNHSFDR